MASLSTWQPYLNPVQHGMEEGRFASGRFTLIASGPPFLANIAGGTGISTETGRDIVYPIGLVQNFGWGSNKAWARFFEIGSDRSVVIAGHTVGQIGLGRVVYDGPSLLRVLWAYYRDALSGIDSLYDNDAILAVHQHNVVGLPPGYENMLLNLASDMFSQPIGLLVVFKNNDLDNLGAYYFERCVVPTHNIGWDATSGIIQESLSIQFERAIPIKMGNVVQLIRGTD